MIFNETSLGQQGSYKDWFYKIIGSFCEFLVLFIPKSTKARSNNLNISLQLHGINF